MCVLVYSEEREREKLHSSIKVSLVFPDRSIIITYGLATPTCRWRVYFKKVTSMPEWKSIYVPSLVEVIFQRYGVAFNYIMTHRLGNGREWSVGGVCWWNKRPLSLSFISRFLLRSVWEQDLPSSTEDKPPLVCNYVESGFCPLSRDESDKSRQQSWGSRTNIKPNKRFQQFHLFLG